MNPLRTFRALPGVCGTLAFIAFTMPATQACTIFVLTDANRALFCNMQEGQYATKYSNVFDLQSGDIFLFPFPGREDEVKLNLAAELEKGGHYYDIPKIRRQLTQAPRPLLNSMKRLFLDNLQPIPDPEPNVTKHLRAIMQDAFGGNMRPEDYTAELWKELAPKQKELPADAKRLGDFVSMTLVDRWEEDDRRNYRYRTEFKNATVLQHFVLDGQNKVALIQSEGIERKPNADVGGD